MGMIEAVFGVVIALIIIVVGGSVLWALAAVNAFMAAVGIVLLVVLAVAIVAGFLRSHT